MTQLAEADEPLVLADGTKIDPNSGKVIKENTAKFVAVPSPSEAQALIVRTRRTVADLPLPPAQMSAVGMVAFYTLFGLNDNDISVALEGRLTVEQVKNVKTLDAYNEFMANAKANIVETETNEVRDIFQRHAKHAAHKIIDIVNSADEDSVLGFKAAQDVLDRAGHRPADIVEHRHSMEDALHIIVTKRSGDSVPVIDLEPEEAIKDA